MSLTQLEKLEGNKLYTKLCGEGYEANPSFKGGLLQLPKKDDIYHTGYNLDYYRNFIANLSVNDLNNVGCLARLGKDSIQKTHGGRFEWLIEWVKSPKTSPLTVNRAFEEIIEGLNWNDALNARPTYWIFMHPNWGCSNNPWTIEKNSKPGYAVMPIFAATSDFPSTSPMFAKDQDTYWRLRNSYRIEMSNKGIIAYDGYGHYLFQDKKKTLIPSMLRAKELGR